MIRSNYAWSFPVFVMVDQKQFQERGLPHGLRLTTLSDRGNVFPIFTEELLAERFIETNKIAGAVPSEIASPDRLLQFAEEAKRAGLKLAVFDVANEGLRRFVELDALIENLSSSD